MKTSFLWIEDGAIADLKYLLAPILVSGDYDPIIALDVSEGIRRLREREFEAVIVDIRIPPGDDSNWISLYNQRGKNKARARLGLQLLTCLLSTEPCDIVITDIPTWVCANRFGVLTVEGKDEVSASLESLGINVYDQKTASTPKTVLEDLVRRIRSNQ